MSVHTPHLGLQALVGCHHTATLIHSVKAAGSSLESFLSALEYQQYQQPDMTAQQRVSYLLDGFAMHHSEKLIVLLQQAQVRCEPGILLLWPQCPLLTHLGLHIIMVYAAECSEAV